MYNTQAVPFWEFYGGYVMPNAKVTIYYKTVNSYIGTGPLEGSGPDDFVPYGTGKRPVVEYGPTGGGVPQGGGGDLGVISTVFGSTGVAGDIASMSNSTFRLANSNGVFSPKIYTPKFNRPYGWKGGFGINTYSISKLGGAVSFGSSVLTTGNAYYDIATLPTEQLNPITYVDAGVGTVGLMNTIALYYAGVQVPYVGEVVVVYGTLRLTWDVFYNLGTNWGPIGAYYGTNKWSKR